MMWGKVRRLLGCTALGLSLALPSLAQAQDGIPAGTETGGTESDAETGLRDIIVTAERRSSNIQSTPIAMAAIGGDDLGDRQIANIESLSSYVPSLSFGRRGGDARIFLRGIGVDATAPGQDSRVAVYTDGVYNARVLAGLSTFYDVERVEVLNGPQGTLYGRNATAGAINIITREPEDDLGGFAKLTIGNYSLVRTEGAVNIPFGDTVAARVAFETNGRSGYGENISTGNDVDDQRTRAVRAKLRFEPSDSFTLLLAGDYFNEDDASGGYHFLGNSPGNVAVSLASGFVSAPDIRDIAGQDSQFRLETYGGSATAEWDMDGVKLTSITAARHLSLSSLGAADPSTAGWLPILTQERSDQFSQELRLAATIGPVELLLGGFYFHEKNFAGNAAGISGAFFGLPPALRHGSVAAGTQKTDAYALFSQAAVRFNDALTLDLGLRYSKENRSIDQFSLFDLANPFDPSAPPFAQSPGTPVRNVDKASWSSVDPRVSLNYQITPRVFAYASFSQGFKSGGFNLPFIQTAFDPEEIKDYEVGIRSDLFDRKLRANVSAFYYDYTNLQVNIVEGTSILTRNAAGAKLYGVEGQFILAPDDRFNMGLNLAWLHSEFTDFITADPGRPALGPLNLAGNQLSYAPEFKVQGDISYRFTAPIGDITPRASVTWQDRSYFSVFNLDYISQPAYALVDLSLTVEPGDGWQIDAFVRNLTDKTYLVSSSVGTSFAGFALLGLVGPPRTFGISVSKDF